MNRFLLTRQVNTTIVVIPAKAGHVVKHQRYPGELWMPDQVQHDEAWYLLWPV
jgi:hypothetical protein